MTALTPIDSPPIRDRPNPRQRPFSGGGVLPLPAVFVTFAAMVGLCLVVGSYAVFSRPDASDRVVLFAVLVLPAIRLAASGSTFLVDYLLILVAANRELRRLLDWGQGQYDSLSLLSLLPLAMAALMVLWIGSRWRWLPPTMRRAGGFLAAAMVYGTGLGVVGYGLPAIYACAEYVTPLIVLYYCLACHPSEAVLLRWATVLGTLGVIVGTYGIYQWISPPPWDVAWVQWSGMGSSMGVPRPYQLSICSTLESRGPAAMFFSISAAALIAVPALRRSGGFLLAAIPAVALLLTQARTGLIYLVLTLVASAFFAGRGKGGLKTLLALIAAGGVTVMFLGHQDHSNVIFDRVGTLSHLEDDGSANGRVGIASNGAMTVLSSPIGFGFGSGGNAVKAAAKPGEHDAVGDNGYLEILSTLGIPGTLLYATGLGMIVRLAIRNRRLSTRSEPITHFGFGLLIALAPVMMIANALITAHAAYMWIFLSRHLAARRDGPTATQARQ